MRSATRIRAGPYRADPIHIAAVVSTVIRRLTVRRTIHAIKEYEAEGKKAKSFVPVGLMWQNEGGKIEFRLELPGFAADSSLVVFRKQDNAEGEE